MKPKFNFREVISLLKASDLVSKIEIRDVDEIKDRGIYKVRCNLIPSRYKLEIKIIYTKGEILYSYQLFTDKPIIRWDNAPHYPKIKTYPHHFHNKDGNVVESELTGIPIEDLKVVLIMIKDMFLEIS
ncbi:MAG: DUF6516 family protein [Nitrospirota bacterium]